MINQGKISYSSVNPKISYSSIDPNNVINSSVEGVGSLTYDTSLIKIGAIDLKHDEYNDKTDITIRFTPAVFTEKALKVLIYTVARLNIQLRKYFQVQVYADLDYALEELDRRERSRHSDDAPLEDEYSYEYLATPEEQEEGVCYLNTWLSYDEDEDSLLFPDGKPVVYRNKGRLNDTRYRIDTLECVVDYLIEQEYAYLNNNA